MSARLVTLATFDSPPRAHIALNALQDAGIWAQLHDESVATSLWTVTNAISGIKLTIREEDIQRAIEIVGPMVGVTITGDTPISDDELTRQALAEAPDEDDPAHIEQDETDRAPSTDESAPQPLDRDRYAWLAFVYGWVGVAIPFIGAVALYYLLTATFGQGPLSKLGRWRLIGASILVIPAVIVSAFFVNMCCAGPRFAP